MLQKVIKFVKDNLVAVVGIAAIAIVCLLMLLPGQFAVKPSLKNPNYTLNGYQYIFNYKSVNGTDYYPMGKQGPIVGIGLAALIMFAISVLCFVFYKKSSSLVLLGGILNVVSSIFFFAMEATAHAEKLYNLPQFKDGTKTVGVIQWVSYVSGAILLLSGAYAIYKAIVLMRDEIKHPQQQKPAYYSYLKK